jgi:hypothetical protein
MAMQIVLPAIWGGGADQFSVTESMCQTLLERVETLKATCEGSEEYDNCKPIFSNVNQLNQTAADCRTRMVTVLLYIKNLSESVLFTA